jgi:hypothetical protein
VLDLVGEHQHDGSDEQRGRQHGQCACFTGEPDVAFGQRQDRVVVEQGKGDAAGQPEPLVVIAVSAIAVLRFD